MIGAVLFLDLAAHKSRIEKLPGFHLNGRCPKFTSKKKNAITSIDISTPAALRVHRRIHGSQGWAIILPERPRWDPARKLTPPRLTRERA